MSVTTWTITSNRFTSNAHLGSKGVTVTSATYTTSDEDIIECDATSTNIAITLLAASTRSGKVYSFKRTDASTNTVTISTAIDGVSNTPLFLIAPFSIYSDGSAWRKMSIGNVALGYMTFVVKTAPYTLTVADEVLICNSATPYTQALPSATGSGKPYSIKNVNAGTITLDGDSSDTIDGELTQAIQQNECIVVIDYAANKWAIL